MRMDDSSTHLSVIVPAELRRQLEQLAHASDRTISAEARRAIAEHVSSPSAVASLRSIAVTAAEGPETS